MPQFHKAVISTELRIKTQKHSNKMELSDENNTAPITTFCVPRPRHLL